MKYFVAMTAMFFVTLPCIAADEQTWVEIDNVVYGAKPDARGPIGGGNGYVNIITEGDYTVRDLDALLEALSKAKSGQVVFMPAETVIDIYNNTFRAQRTPVVIRGVPEEKCEVRHNWFMKHSAAGQAVRASEKTKVFSNIYTDKPKVAN
jgi:hypothetical protein